jgi:hypothetical protein
MSRKKATKQKKSKRWDSRRREQGRMIVFAGMFNCRAPDAPSLDFFHWTRDLNPSVVYGSGRPYLSATRRVQRKYMKIVGYM